MAVGKNGTGLQMGRIGSGADAQRGRDPTIFQERREPASFVRDACAAMASKRRRLWWLSRLVPWGRQGRLLLRARGVGFERRAGAGRSEHAERSSDRMALRKRNGFRDYGIGGRLRVPQVPGE